MNKTPLSIKIIGWIYTLLGGFFILLILLAVLMVSFRIFSANAYFPSVGSFQPPEPPTIEDLLEIIPSLFILATANILIITLGQGLIRLKKLAWYFNFLFIASQFVLFFYISNTPDLSPLYILLPWNAFVIYGTWANRKLFGI